MAMLPSKDKRPLCLLSLDGGGIRGLSELLIIQEIMNRLQRVCNVTKPIPPADVFHLMGGTSTGGLIALLLGRLRLTMDEAISCYCAIANDVFTTSKAPWKDGRFKSSILEKAIKKAIEGTLGSGHCDDLMYDTNQEDPCKSFVCAMEARHISQKPTKFRTWPAAKDASFNCKIWEAARATSAAPRLFKRVLIGQPLRQQEFVDGALGCNNPIQHVIEEATQEFETDRVVGCILSIGTGMHRAPGFERPRGYQRIIPKDLINVLAKMATDSNVEAERVSERFRDYNQLYYRLNAGIEVGDIQLDECARLSEVEAHTTAYLRNREISRQVDQIVEALRGKTSQVLPLGSLSSDQPLLRAAAENRELIQFPDHPKNKSNFVYRTEMDVIKSHLDSFREHPESRILVLYGTAGAGKTQLALQCCREARESQFFSGVLWIDGTSMATVDECLLSAARRYLSEKFDSLDTEETKAALFRFISNSNGPWIVVIDNYDDVEAYGVESFLPSHGRTFSIITSRDRSTQHIGPSVLIGDMLEEEALRLLFGNTLPVQSLDLIHDGRELVQRLGCLALAVAQASAYICDRRMDIGCFLELYDVEKRRIQTAVPKIWHYIRANSKSILGPPIPLSVATTWELSLNLLSGDPDLKAAKICLLTVSAFLGRAVITENIFLAYFQSTKTKPAWSQALVNENSSLFDLYRFREILAEMGRLCLLQDYQIDKRDGITWRLHPVVQDWIQHRQPDEKCQELTNLALDILECSLDNYGPQYPTFQGFSHIHNILRPHVEACYNNCQRFFPEAVALGQTETASSTLKLANFFAGDGKYDLAEKLQRKVVTATEPGSRPNRSSLRQLAKTLYQKGELSEAATLQEELKAHLAPSISNIEDAIILLDLAITKRDLADASTESTEISSLLEISSNLASQGVEATKRIAGSRAKETASAMMLFASIEYQRGRLESTKALEEEALSICLEARDPHDAKTLELKQSLSVTLAKIGQTQKAISMQQEVWESRSRILGLDHPSSLSSKLLLARALRLDGQLVKAREINEDVLARTEKTRGLNHPKTQRAAGGLWRCLIAERNMTDADKLQDLYNLILNAADKDMRAAAS